MKPMNPTTYTLINKDTDLQYASDFFPIVSSNLRDFPRLADQTPATAVGRYTSFDPRLVDPIRNQMLVLDKPPFQFDNIRMHNIYDEGNRDVRTQSYTDYDRIRGGNTLYYWDTFLDDPKDPYNYVTPSTTEGQVFVDPMGALKPQYRVCPTMPVQSDYSFDRDQIAFREDLISHQQAHMWQTDPSIFHANKARMTYARTGFP